MDEEDEFRRQIREVTGGEKRRDPLPPIELGPLDDDAIVEAPRPRRPGPAHAKTDQNGANGAAKRGIPILRSRKGLPPPGGRARGRGGFRL